MRKFVFGGSFGSDVPLLLDLYPSTQGQYYMHKVSSTYMGACIRVRRSTDNVEQDIGFIGVDLDTTALAAFVGSNNGFVTTWYSQSGFFDLTQTDAAKQPAIVLSGVLQTLNGKPCLKYDGVNDFMTGGTSANNINANMYAVSIGELLANGTLFGKSRAAGVNQRYAIIRSNTTFALLQTSTEYQRQFGNQTSAKMWSMLIRFVPSVVFKLETFLNNALNTTDPIAGTILPSSHRFLIGGYPNGTDTGEILLNNGKIQCFGFWSGEDEEAKRNDINTIINNYYGIY